MDGCGGLAVKVGPSLGPHLNFRGLFGHYGRLLIHVRTGRLGAGRNRGCAFATRRRLWRRAALVLFVGFTLSACRSPKAPTPRSDAEFFTSADGARLHFSLDLPPGTGPFPAVVFGHGAGRTTKDELSFYLSSFREQGFAVLRYDKRGIGRSTGIYVPMGPHNSESVVPQLAADMTAAVRFLATRPEIAPGRIGLVGVSQAGWIMAETARRAPDVRFTINIVGSVLPVATNTFYEHIPTSLPLDEAYAQLSAYAGPPGWDPMPALDAAAYPAIWLLGADDRIVPTREVVRRLDQLIARGHAFRAIVYPGAGHGLSGQTGRFFPDVFAWMVAQGLR